MVASTPNETAAGLQARATTSEKAQAIANDAVAWPLGKPVGPICR